jgi:AraC-like DNA-binding protein
MHHLTEVLCWLGALQSLLLGSYLMTSRQKQLRRYLLAAMFIAISIRVFKSTLFLFHADATSWIMNTGFAAQCLISPLLYFYVRSFDVKFRFIKIHLLQFVPAFGILITSPLLELDTFWYTGGYSALLYLAVIYLSLSWYEVYRQHSSYPTSTHSTFLPLVLTVMSVFQLSYFTNYTLRLTPYLAGPLLNTISVYIITFLVLKNEKRFLSEERKYSNLRLLPEQVDLYASQIRTVMEQSKPYLENDFSLARLSELVNIPEHILSYVFGERFGANFTQMVMRYRIEQAKMLLKDPSKDHYSIAGISSECGFNSLSAFNSAFRKYTQQTPSAYKKQFVSNTFIHT